MNKLFKMLLFVLILWGISFMVAVLFFDEDTTISGDQIAIIPVQGMITFEGGDSLLSSSSSGERIAEEIKEANEDESVKAIILEINSPGGTVMGSKVVADEVKNVDKPVVALITESGTSGAYWIASQADYIVADQLSIVGSIGVLGSYLEYGGLLEDYNVTYERLVTAQYKDIGTPYREMTTEEKALMLDRLDEIHAYFVQEVAKGRHMQVEDVDALANGLFYLGQDGIQNGLVDYIGDKDYAINLTKQLAGVSDGEVSEYTQDESLFGSFLDKYLSYSSYYIGVGIGKVLFSVQSPELNIYT